MTFEKYVEENLNYCVFHYLRFYKDYKKKFWIRHLFFNVNIVRLHEYDRRAGIINKVYRNKYGHNIKDS